MRLTRVAAPSKAGRNAGKMKPPDWLAARVTFSDRATSMRWEADSLVQTISAPASRQIFSAAPLAATGRAIRAPGTDSVMRVTSTSSASSWLSMWPVSSTMSTNSPPGSRTAPRWAPEARTSSDTRAAAAGRSKARHVGRVGVRVDHQHLGLELGQQVGHDEARRAERVVEHQLQARADRADGRSTESMRAWV